MKRFILILLAAALLCTGCALTPAPQEASPAPVTQTPAVSEENNAAKTDPMSVETIKATMVVKDFGTIELELYPSIAPQSVCNFCSLARQGYYDGLTFHRIVTGFMIQGGDPNGNGLGGPGYTIKGEFANNGVENDISHVRGVISYGRRGNDYDSAGSQIFIVHADSTFLDGDYAAFGRVTSGMEVVDAIAAVKTGDKDKPIDPVVIESVVIDGPELFEPEKLN